MPAPSSRCAGFVGRVIANSFLRHRYLACRLDGWCDLGKQFPLDYAAANTPDYPARSMAAWLVPVLFYAALCDVRHGVCIRTWTIGRT